jgi:hypothetical protein
MNNRLSFRALGSISLLALGALSLGAAACTTDLPIDGSGGGTATSTAATMGDATTAGTTTGGMTTGGMTTGGTSTGGGGGAGGGQPFETIALLDMLIPQVPDSTKNMWLTPGEKLDPTTLLVIVSTESQACNAPVFDLGTKNHHQVLIGLPQSLQKVGKYDLSSTDVIAYGTSWLGDGMGNGGGVKAPLTTGTVEVVSIDTGSIKVHLEGLDMEFLSQEGDHVATICPSGV